MKSNHLRWAVFIVSIPSDTVRQAQRVKADEETHPLAELEYEKEPTSFRAASTGY